MKREKKGRKAGYIFLCMALCGVFFGVGAKWMQHRTSEEHTALIEEVSALTDRNSVLTDEHLTVNGELQELADNFSAMFDRCLEARGHGTGTAQSSSFTESSRELKNPNRGFYRMHGFWLRDEKMDFRGNVAGRFAGDRGNGLTLIQVNLQSFREREISAEGLESLDNLLEALAGVDKQIILRFQYDWDGKNLQFEPDSLDLILRHMEQVSALLKKYEDRIFLVQGLFVGNYGEMNNSKYLSTEDLQALTGKMFEAVGENTYLSVRTPTQWRNITEISDPSETVGGSGSLASRMGLYNDGMLGSITDCGTYGMTDQAEQNPFSQWSRHEELAFQDILCRLVPNGGEVIIDNEYNDFENAVEDMKAMHITYLNWAYDPNVIAKWEKTIVNEESCFDGMDGLTYMERHLGYRLVLREAALEYDWKTDKLTAGITLQNVGFAPVYREAEVKLALYDRERGREYAYSLDSGQDIRSLVGGTESQKHMTLNWELPMSGLPQGELEIWFSITDVLSGDMILLGNEQEPESRGYRVGTLTLGDPEELREAWMQETPSWLAPLVD